MKRLIKLMSIILCLAIALSTSLMGVFALSLQGVSLKSDEDKATADEAPLYKEETVYVMAKADGTVDKIIVSDWIKNNDHADVIKDVAALGDINTAADFFFIGETDEELSLVCKTEDTPSRTVEREDGWKGFRIRGVLDFSLVGILSKLSGILAEHKIGIFAVSTYNTDYILVKKERFEQALEVLASEGYTVV